MSVSRHYTAVVAEGGKVSFTRSGGRSTSKELILAEARRRVAEAPDSIPDILKVWADDLVEWLATAHPDVMSVKPRSVQGYLSDLHRIARLRKSQRR
jgi:hypothetical protein